MIERRIREHTDAEIEVLKSSGALWQFRLGEFLFILFVHFLLYCGGGWVLGKGLDYLLSLVFPGAFRSAMFAPILLVCGSIAALVSIVQGERARIAARRASAQGLEASLRRGKVEEITCDVTEVAELEEYEDEGSGFFFQVAPNVLLFLQGQHFMVDAFPSNRIFLVRDAESHTIFDEEHSGGRLKPKRYIRSSAFGGVEWLRPGMFIHGAIDTLPDHVASIPKSRDVLSEVL